MPEPFKTWFNPVMIGEMAGHLAAADPTFDRAGFAAFASDGLDALELKARAGRITAALEAFLPADFAAACAVLEAALHPEQTAELAAMTMDARGIRGWAVMPMAEFVARRGLGDFDRSMALLAAMTTRFSAEFAVRPFIAQDPDRAMEWLMRWAQGPNPHVRRLASEGSRPRLPWGMQLRGFVADPAPLIPLLRRLRDDPSEYVRRSVANSLNDISKDHPVLVAALAEDWLRDAGPERSRLVRHACRTLVRLGHAGALAALGHGPAEVVLERLELASPMVAFGSALEFAAVLRAHGAKPQRIVLDYVVHHRKANGSASPKIFKWKLLALAPGETVMLRRRHPMRPITTRVYRDGAHRVEIVANGLVLGGADFELAGAG